MTNCLRRDIFVITSENTGYMLSTSLGVKWTLPLGPRAVSEGIVIFTTCIAVHSNVLVRGDTRGGIDIAKLHSGKLVPVKRIYIQDDMITDLSMNGSLIMAGT